MSCNIIFRQELSGDYTSSVYSDGKLIYSTVSCTGAQRSIWYAKQWCRENEHTVTKTESEIPDHSLLGRMLRFAQQHYPEHCEIVGNELLVGSIATCGNYSDYGNVVCTIDYVTTWKQLEIWLGY